MSLVNERLYNMEGVGDVYLKTFVQDILTHFGQIFPIEHPLSMEHKMDENVVVSADFAVSFGLLLSELVVNSYKYAFPNNAKPALNLSISIEKDSVLHFEYTDFGKVEAPSVFQTKQIGGVTLIQDLTRQLKGNMVIHHEPHLFYTFSFPLLKNN
jgi:two-component sensor histidine kinase